jgi:serine/threonine protein kinase
MNRELERHGFVGIDTIRDDYSNVCDVIPATHEIARLGSHPVTIQGLPWKFLDRSLTRDDLHVGWYVKELYKEGTYGKIFKAFRAFIRRVTTGDGHEGFVTASAEALEVVLKQTQPTDGRIVLTAEEVKAHISEALLHVLAWNVLQRTSMPWAVPRPYEMFGEAASDDSWSALSLCMDFVQGRTLHTFLEQVWKRESPRQNAVVLLEVLGQTACILYALQRYLRLNHRDVKDNNLLIRRRSAASGPVRLRLGGVELQTTYELTLIDFGFACVGCPPPRAPVSAFQASTYFPSREMCCKVGRDLAQLIYCIHCYFPLQEFLPWELYREVRSWVQVRWNGGVADLLHGFADEAGTPRAASDRTPPKYDKGIYEFLRRAEVDVEACEPVRLFGNCCRLKRRYL